jgi:hypothetical protein
VVGWLGIGCVEPLCICVSKLFFSFLLIDVDVDIYKYRIQVSRIYELQILKCTWASVVRLCTISELAAQI